MNDDTIISMIWIAGALALVGSALVHRNLGGRRALMLALLWVGIILSAWGVVALIQRWHG